MAFLVGLPELLELLLPLPVLGLQQCFLAGCRTPFELHRPELRRLLLLKSDPLRRRCRSRIRLGIPAGNSGSISLGLRRHLFLDSISLGALLGSLPACLELQCRSLLR